MRIIKDDFKVPALEPGDEPTIVSMVLDVYADDRMIGVFKLAPENKGEDDIGEVRRDIVDMATQAFKVDPRDFRYFEDRQTGGQRYAERTFDRGTDGVVRETKPVGDSPEKSSSPAQLEAIRNEYGARENRLMAGHEWMTRVKHAKGFNP